MCAVGEPWQNTQKIGERDMSVRYTTISALSMETLKETAEQLDLRIHGSGKRGTKLKRDYIRQIEAEMRRTGTMIID